MEFAADELSEKDWDALAAIRMTEAGFEPAEIKDLTEPAVCFARALTSLVVQGRIGRLGEDVDYGEINAPPKG